MSLYKSDQSVKEISKTVGLTERIVQKWINRLWDGGAVDLPEQGHHSGRPIKVIHRTGNMIRRQVEANPRISAGEIKENNPLLLADVSKGTVQRIHEMLHAVTVVAFATSLVSLSIK